MSSLVPQSVDYTDKDFDALNVRLERLIRSVFPDWTDFNVLTFGNIMKQLFAFVGDVLTFYQDAQAAEAFIPTATQRRSIINLAKLIGFELPGQTAATVEVTLSVATPPAGSVTFPAGTVARTETVGADAVRFQTLSEVLIPALADPPEVTVQAENSEPQEQLLESNGLPDQAFLLSFAPYLDDSLQISTTQGEFEEVDSFLDSGPTDRHFTVEVDQNDRATVRFGDGTNGLIPTGTITTEYKTGGGEAGNVEAGLIRIVEGNFQDSFANDVRVSANNVAKATGGGPRMSVATARLVAPTTLRVLNRTVAREDYEINAVKVDGVARALMLTADQDPNVAENVGYLRVIPTGGGAPSQALLDAVFDQVTVEFPNTITFKVFVIGPTYLTINIEATVFLRQGANAATVKQAILDNLDAYFALETTDETGDTVPNPTVDFGFNFKDADGNPAGEIPVSDLYNVIRDTTGVRKIGDKFEDFLLNGSDRDVPIDIHEFPLLGTVTLTNGDTGQPL